MFVSQSTDIVPLGISWPECSRWTCGEAKRPFSAWPSAPGSIEAVDAEGGHHQEDQERRGQEHERDRQMDQRHFRPAQIEATANCTLHKVRFWLSDDSQFCIFTTHKIIVSAKKHWLIWYKPASLESCRQSYPFPYNRSVNVHKPIFYVLTNINCHSVKNF